MMSEIESQRIDERQDYNLNSCNLKQVLNWKSFCGGWLDKGENLWLSINSKIREPTQ
jgi:hypothetical protein